MTGPDPGTPGPAPGTVRPVRPADAAACRRLQSHLPRPSPRLLDWALAGSPGSDEGGRAGSVEDRTDGAEGRTTATGDRTGGTDGAARASTLLVTTAGDGSGPVGYLLAVTGPATHVAEVVVGPGHRREGRARALFRALFARRPGPVTVATAPDNEAALALYASLGFERDRVDPEFYGDDPAVLLSRGAGTGESDA